MKISDTFVPTNKSCAVDIALTPEYASWGKEEVKETNIDTQGEAISAARSYDEKKIRELVSKVQDIDESFAISTLGINVR